MSEEKENQPTNGHEERLSVGDSSVELNADGIKISANSITLHQQVMQSENRLMTIDKEDGTIHFQK